MAKLKLKKIIGNNAHWTLNKSLVKQLGLTETLVLQHIIDLTESAFKRDEVFQPYEEIANELGISEYSVKQAVGKLKSAELINVERKSVGFKNFYSVNADKVMEYVSGSVNSLAHTNSTHQSVEGPVHTNSTHSAYENDSLEHTNSTLSEVNPTNSAYEMIGAITNNTTNNTEQIINPNNTTNQKTGNIKNITEKILDILMDANTPVIIYNKAVDDYNELGKIDGVAEIMEWDAAQKQNWLNKIININAIR
jgi:biotin operon repressor